MEINNTDLLLMEQEFMQMSFGDKIALYYNAFYTNNIRYFFKIKLNTPDKMSFEDFIILKGL